MVADDETSDNPASAPSLSDEDRLLCFVCTSDEPAQPVLTDICGCRGLAVHATCQQRMIESAPAHSTRCAVCLQPYKNVSYELRRVKRPDRCLLEVACGVVLTFHFCGALLGSRACMVSFLVLLFAASALLAFCCSGAEWTRVAVVQSVPPFPPQAVPLAKADHVHDRDGSWLHLFKCSRSEAEVLV
jgi:hypothetical protein